MTVTLTPEQEQFISDKVQSGEYNSPVEVVSDSLRLLRERESLLEANRDELRREIQKGMDCFTRGNYTVLDPNKPAGDYAQEIIAETKRRRAEKQAEGHK